MMVRTKAHQATKREGELYLALPPLPQSNPQARTALSVFFQQVLGKLSDRLELTFYVAIGEAVSNAIEHSQSSSFIEITANIDEQRVVVWVRDHGNGFAPKSLTLPEPDSEHGRGLPLMVMCSDTFDIQSTPCVGTTVRLEARLTRPTDGDALN